jgi:hypothetical protein
VRLIPLLSLSFISVFHSSQILGPAIFGVTYMKTVATFPRTIFFLAVAAVIVSLILLSLVRLPKDVVMVDDLESAPRDESSVDILN